jgi:GrpB-like predicted nucleotidyltransferase (UPF0157 family)
MQGRSVAPILRGESPDNWRKSVYYRYYHSPGHHNTVAHLGVRTATHKLIHYWKQDVYEMYDLAVDSNEQRNLLFEDGAKNPEVAAKFAELKKELTSMQQEYKDTENLYADPATWPSGGADGPWSAYEGTGKKTIKQAIEAAVQK